MAESNTIDGSIDQKTSELVKLQDPSNDDGTSGEYYEMYFDATQKAPYYYNPKTGTSIWDLPKGAICADMTASNMEHTIADEQEQEAQGEMSEAKKKELEIEELKRQNLESMYPEYYNNPTHVKEESDQEEGEGEDEDEQEAQFTDFAKYKEVVRKELIKRPARRQVKDLRKDTAYIEGNYDYNIWYDKYLTDQRQEEEKVASMYKCNPIEDTGYTKADKYEKVGYFCTYFARGC